MGESSSHAPGSEIADGAGGIRQRKSMASGDGAMSGGNFGVGSIPGTATAGSMGSSEGTILGDKERGCSGAIKVGGGMHAQAHPDHGSMR